MAQDTAQQATEQVEAVVPGWRFRIGVAFFVLAIISPVGVPLVALTDLSTTMKATLSGLFLAGLPEVFTVAAVAFLGKSGFNYLKGKLFARLKRYGPPREVSIIRYRVGIVMLLIPILFAYLIAYAPQYIPGYGEHSLYINLGIDFILIASFFVLGGDFWDKVRSLFEHGAKAQFPAH